MTHILLCIKQNGEKCRAKRESLDEVDPSAPPPDDTLGGCFGEVAPEGPTFKKLRGDQTFFDGLRELDPSLLTNFKGQHGILSRHVVLPGISV